MSSYPISWRSILILSSYLRLSLPSGLFPSGFTTKTLYALLLSPIRASADGSLKIVVTIIRTCELGNAVRRIRWHNCSCAVVLSYSRGGTDDRKFKKRNSSWTTWPWKWRCCGPVFQSSLRNIPKELELLWPLCEDLKLQLMCVIHFNLIRKGVLKKKITTDF